MSHLKNNQYLQNIQDQTHDYQAADWNGKETPYLDPGERQGDQTTEQPELERRTVIPNTKNVQPQPQHTSDGKYGYRWVARNVFRI